MSESITPHEHDLRITFYESEYPNQHFLKTKFPYWYAQASSELHIALYTSQLKSHFSQRALKKIVKPLKSVYDFAWPLLNQKLLDQFDIHADCRYLYVGKMTSVTPTSVADEAPALVAALQNFPDKAQFDERTALYFHENFYPPGIDGLNKVSVADVCEGEQVGCVTGVIHTQPAAFAEMCRGLDLGRQYQEHLDSVFKPQTLAIPPVSARESAVTAAFILAARHRFEVLCHLALMQKHISMDAYKALLEVASLDGRPVWQGGPVSYHTLRLFSRSPFKDGLLQGVLMFEAYRPTSSGGTAAAFRDEDGPVVVYMPHEPDHPLREYESLNAFVDVLRRKLDDDVYLQYFGRFVSLRYRTEFFRKMHATLRPKGRDGAFDAKADLQLQRLNPNMPPFQALHDQALDKVYDNARMVAVPTRDSKSTTRQAGYQLLKKFAHELYEVADFFMPVSEVRDLFKDAFFAVDSWSEGETEEALSYLFDIGKNIALIALPKSAVKEFEALQKAYEDGKKAAEVIKSALEVTGLTDGHKRTGRQITDADGDADEETPYALIEVSELEAQGREWVEKATPPSEFVESLVQVTSAQGKIRLWKPTLAPLQQPVAPPRSTLLDDRSLFRMGGRTWLSMDGYYYEVVFDATLKKWRVENPGGYPSYAPMLETNDAGAWRYEGENPMGWDASTAFRRLHGNFALLSEVSVRRILQITEVDEALLRRVHVDKLVPPALLVDCAQRFRINDEITDFVHLMEGKGAERLINEILTGNGPTPDETVEPQDSYVIPDIRPYLDFIVTLPGWPEGHALRRINGKGRVVSTHPPASRAPRTIDVTYVPGNINALLDAVLDGLSPLEVQLLLINYRGPRTHREYLAYRIASEAKGRRTQLFTRIYDYRCRPASPDALMLSRDFPSLPDSVAREILGSATHEELDFLRSNGRIPLRLAESAREYVQQLRVNRALESFFFTEMVVPDSSVVTLSLVDNLPAWSPELVVDVREESFVGSKIVRLGDSRASVPQRVLVRATPGYQIFDGAGQRLDRHYHSLLGSLLHLIPTEARAQAGLTDKQSLSAALGELAISKRDKVKQAMGLQKIKPGVKWPSRLPDGRLGYPLSARMRALFGKLKSGAPVFSPELAAQNLYPQFTPAQVKGFLDKLVEGYTGGAHAKRDYVRARLHELTAEYRALEYVLDLWKAELAYGEAAPTPGATYGGREAARIRILASWRRENEVAVGPAPENRVHRLDLSSLPIGRLPEIKANFDHVSELLLENLSLGAENVETFIARFSGVKMLSLRSNRLAYVPVSVGNSYSLERLVLSNNPLILEGVGMTRLQRLASLRILELEGTGIDIRITPDLSHWPVLTELKLRGCGLTVMPTALGELENLRHVDMRHNQISDISEEAFRLIASRPLLYVRLHHNPLSEQTIARATQILDNTALLRMGIVDVAPPYELLMPQADWLMQSGLQEQRLCLDNLRNVPNGNAFFRLLDDMALSAEFRDNRHLLSMRAWRMVEAMCASESLREELFGLAAHPTTCGDGATLIFNALDVRVLVFMLLSSQSSIEPVPMFKLVRGLERLDELERIAQEDFTTRLPANVRLDLAEVRLIYPTRLREELELPGQAMTMLFESLSGVSQQMLDSAKERVLARENTPAFFQSMIARDVWMEFLQQHYAQRFAVVTEPFHDRLDALDKEPEAKYLADVAALAVERKNAVDALAMQLTRDIAGVSSPG